MPIKVTIMQFCGEKGAAEQVKQKYRAIIHRFVVIEEQQQQWKRTYRQAKLKVRVVKVSGQLHHHHHHY